MVTAGGGSPPPCDTDAGPEECCDDAECCEDNGCDLSELCDRHFCDTPSCEDQVCESTACDYDSVCNGKICDTHSCADPSCDEEPCEFDCIDLLGPTDNYLGYGASNPLALDDALYQFPPTLPLGDTAEDAKCLLALSDQRSRKTQVSTSAPTAGFDVHQNQHHQQQPRHQHQHQHRHQHQQQQQRLLQNTFTDSSSSWHEQNDAGSDGLGPVHNLFAAAAAFDGLVWQPTHSNSHPESVHQFTESYNGSHWQQPHVTVAGGSQPASQLVGPYPDNMVWLDPSVGDAFEGTYNPAGFEPSNDILAHANPTFNNDRCSGGDDDDDMSWLIGAGSCMPQSHIAAPALNRLHQSDPTSTTTTTTTGPQDPLDDDQDHNMMMMQLLHSHQPPQSQPRREKTTFGLAPRLASESRESTVLETPPPPPTLAESVPTTTTTPCSSPVASEEPSSHTDGNLPSLSDDRADSFVCLWDQCGREFDSQEHLQIHCKEGHLKDLQKDDLLFTCRWSGCGGGKCSQRSKLERHVQTHTGYKPVRCDICNQRFSAKQALAQHRRTHTGERPFRCKYCPKKFKQQSALTMHRRTHTGEKPLECEICKKHFSESSNLSKHRKIHNTT